MTNMIDRVGRFRGKPLQWVFQPTKNGFPQFIVQLQATEFYDTESGEWVDWSEYNQEIRAYLVLFNAEKALMNYEQVQKVFGWDGVDFSDLQSGDYANLMLQFEVEESNFNGVDSLKVNWIDTYDANPTRTLTPMNPNELKQLTAQFKHLMKGKAKPAPAKAPTKPAPPAAPPAPPAAPAPTPAPKPPKAKPGPKAKAPVQEEEADTVELPSSITKEEAWEFLFKRRDKSLSDDKLADAWIDACTAVGADKEESDFTDEDWASVRDHCITALGIVPF